MSKKFLYLFKEGHDAFGGDQTTMKNILGGKGAGLAEMTHAGMPVPQGFTITTEACTQYYADGREINEEIKADIFKYMGILEEQTGKKFGDIENPLLVSVRSGARQSMPGMMDTILNLGLNDQAVEGLAKKTSNPRFAYDCYRRFIQMYSDVVMELGKSFFEEKIDERKAAKGGTQDVALTADDLKELGKQVKASYLEKQGSEFPQDPKEQLIGAVKAVFRSWDNPRANVYRKMNEIPYEWGTAVNVQQMAFGNSGMRSGTGVAFTRNPATGEHQLMGEYLINAQGEDVVAGIRTPSPISKLHEEMPEVYDQFQEIATRLEKYFKDMQDMEFTIEDGKLFMLQTRNGKRTAQAALKIAIDLVDEGMIDEREAVLRVEPKQLDTLLHPQFDAAALKAAEVIGKGLAASPGSACGQIVFTAEEAEEMVKSGKMPKVVLVRLETSPEDIVGMQVSQGILTVRGGMTSHAAVVARGMGVCCVSGCGNDNDVKIDYEAKTFEINGHKFAEGDWISIDGATGNIYGEQVATVAATENPYLQRFMGWADAARQLKVFTNADNPTDAQNAVNMGAEGIGLCRTEHMFFAADRIKAVREMICARTVEDRKKALAKVEPYQEADFTAMYRIMGDRPMTVRYLDPPLHEFLPTKAEDIAELAQDMGMSAEELTNIVESLHEFNPMMGHRGCRLAVTYPEIAEMQTNAVIKAALKVSAETGKMITPHIMIPLVGEVKELKYVKDVVVATADKLIAEAGVAMKYQVGTMIEIPRAALTAGEIAREADFFSFGTNDLTQMTFGFSRDDAAKFLTAYYDTKIYESDPFQHLDQIGVGKLVKMAAHDGRETNPNLGLGICGEHGGDPSSVEFCHNVGLDYVSCSPYRVPIARLAAAQAAIKAPRAMKD
ncbi:MAG: pyruvate, phosphate dikinase [Gemmiger sp.]|uniref:pyruvate, phosphate dikinase n=1 Tax=Gemmiger sp. TaxID=2049027 RepID=UPI002A83BD88|nr:pyruvate, phosphate dikinase [Gemmiger sp.]MDY4773278.1 pyruvate, phosphate dikinase [Gemmiger sp.]